jgi:hypothetical protein
MVLGGKQFEPMRRHFLACSAEHNTAIVSKSFADVECVACGAGWYETEQRRYQALRGFHVVSDRTKKLDRRRIEDGAGFRTESRRPRCSLRVGDRPTIFEMLDKRTEEMSNDKIAK